MQFSPLVRWLPIFIISIFLSACGGGGGGGSASYIAPSLVSTTYSGNQQTKTYSDGSNVINTASGSSASYASNHTTRTTVYNYSDGGSNSVVDTVSPTAGSPTYVGNTQTIVTTYGDGYTTTANNTATGSSISWASDHTTRTTTYTFANGGTNAVVATVNPTVSTPALTAANYPGNWTTTGTVTAPSVSAKNNVYGDGYTAAIENGTSSKPFLQTTLSALSISDPSSYVTSSTATYNLTWGTPDKNGPSLAALFPSASTQLSSGLSYYTGISVSGQGVAGPTLVQPSSDVLAAWNAGWTGKNTNILVIDGYASIGACNNSSTCHGITTAMITDLVAPGATKYYVDYGYASFLGTYITSGHLKDAGGNTFSAPAIQAVNARFGLYWTANGWNPNLSSDRTTAYNFILPYITTWTNYLNGTRVSGDNTLIAAATNAVVSKSAGNDAIDAKYEYLAKAFSTDSSIGPRLLVVGALTKNGTVASPASLASYSNFAGTDSTIASRFVLANGNAPYANGGVKINGSNIAGYDGGNVGTSYAAPIVAGYAAVVMQKFPNLTAASTSNIILDTARTDTLSCSPSCDPAIYGKGEASLSRALAPVGRLR